MVTRGCAGARGEVCAVAVRQKLPTNIAPSAAHGPTTIEDARSVIERHAPGNAADRHRDDRLAAPGIDDGDVVAEAVGDEEPLPVARQRDAPRALADQDVA